MATVLDITHSDALIITRNQTTMALINATILPITFSGVLDITGPSPYVP